VEDAAIASCQSILGYTFEDPSLLHKALTHSSVAATRLDSNERMEFLGDAVLGLVICERLYRSQTRAMEGQLTQVKSVVVSRQTCAAVADEIGLTDAMRLGRGFALADVPSSLAAGVLESVIGAIYLDGGLEPARQFILRTMERHMDAVLANQYSLNYKSILQQYAQREWNCTPEYEVLDEKGPDHAKAFEIGVFCNGRRYPSAWGSNKKQAEQLAARAALLEVGAIDPEQEEDTRG
jgi:ribonuclease III